MSHISKCPSSAPVIEGIDVSSYQPTIDWPSVYESGRRFAFIRTTVAAWVDPKFAEHARGAQEASLLVGGYHFAMLGTDPKTTALRFCELLVDHDALGMPPVLDLEQGSESKAWRDNPTPVIGRTIALWVDAWVETVETFLGITPMIYTGLGYVLNPKRPIPFTDRAKGTTLWAAQYGVKEPSLFAPWNRIHVWQYAGNELPNAPGGQCPGIKGDVDLNAWLGSEAELYGFIDKLRGQEDTQESQAPSMA